MRPPAPARRGDSAEVGSHGSSPTAGLSPEAAGSSCHDRGDTGDAVATTCPRRCAAQQPQSHQRHRHPCQRQLPVTLRDRHRCHRHHAATPGPPSRAAGPQPPLPGIGWSCRNPCGEPQRPPQSPAASTGQFWAVKAALGGKAHLTCAGRNTHPCPRPSPGALDLLGPGQVGFGAGPPARCRQPLPPRAPPLFSVPVSQPGLTLIRLQPRADAFN